MPPIEENDLFILYRDDDSLRKVTVEQMKEEFGGGTPIPIDFDAIISGSTAIGSTLTARVENLVGGDGVYTYTYQWFSDGVTIPSANSDTYVTTNDDGGKPVTCNIIVRDSVGLTKSKTSNAITVDAPPDPPVITQNPVISSDNNYTTEPITVTQNAIVTDATKASETWVKDGVDLNVGGNTYTPTDEGRYTFKEVFTGNDSSTVTATSNELTIAEEETDPDEDLTEPNAVMKGLRFDKDRQTFLRNSISAGNQWTMSFWFKPVVVSSNLEFMSVGALSGNQYIFEQNGSGFGHSYWRFRY